MNKSRQTALAPILIILTTVALVFGQRPIPDSPLKSLVLTEQGFSKMAELQGTPNAFLAFIADDGILFRPTAVNGKQWLLANPSRASNKRPLLAWQPRFADVSSAGDLGYTTGPWEFKGDIKDEKPSAFGDFITVWKKQPSGLWKFAIDLGISHPESSAPLELMRVTNATVVRRSKNPAGSVDELIARDQEFKRAVERLGTTQAYSASAAQTFRLFRDGSAPFVGKKAALESLTARNESITWQQGGNGIADSGDLGYIYGTYEAKSATQAKPERGNYLRIWKKDGATWRIVLEVESRLQE